MQELISPVSWIRIPVPPQHHTEPIHPTPPGPPPLKTRIPVPPYDQELPPDYWDGLRTPKPRAKRSWPWMEIWAWTKLAAVGLCLLAMMVGICLTNHSNPTPEPVRNFVPLASDRPAPPPSAPPPNDAQPDIPVPVVPRATQVTDAYGKPLITMLAGHRYSLNLPDGRQIKVNFKGYVDHACNLPPQHGINNAAYTDKATGLTWIWTVPAGVSNVPQWIDP